MNYRNNNYTMLTNTQSISQFNSRICDLENELIDMKNTLSKKLEPKEYTFSATFGKWNRTNEITSFKPVDEKGNEYPYSAIGMFNLVTSQPIDINFDIFKNIYDSKTPPTIESELTDGSNTFNMVYKFKDDITYNIIFGGHISGQVINSYNNFIRLTYNTNSNKYNITIGTVMDKSPWYNDYTNSTRTFTIKYT